LEDFVAIVEFANITSSLEDPKTLFEALAIDDA
jgi:hypothetical protein